jgi:uncharacterized cupin superfamily protein
MPRVNLRSDNDLQPDPDDPEGFRAKMWRFGPQLGSKATGTSLYEIPPGQAICPYHYEYGEEEWLLVLDGSPTVRTPEGETVSQPYDVWFFPPGPEGAHRVDNKTDQRVIVLMYSQVVYPGCTVYPDSDKIGIWPEKGSPDVTIVRRSSAVGYFDGEA